MNSLSVRIALRELAGGLNGFRVYIACLSLGAFAIAATGSVTESFNRGLVAEQRMLLGGDIAFTVVQRRASPEERRWLDQQGAVSEMATLNVMGDAGGVRQQVDLRAVDHRHPLIGAPDLSGGATSLEEALALRDGAWGAAVSATTLKEFSLDIGDRIQLGPIEFEIRTQLDREADGLGAAGRVWTQRASQSRCASRSRAAHQWPALSQSLSYAYRGCIVGCTRRASDRGGR